MPSSVGSGSTDRNSPEAGPRGFTAINITPPHSRGMHTQRVHKDKTNGPPESSATSPDVSPRQSTAGAGRQGNYYITDASTGSHKRRRSMSPGQDLSPPRYDYYPPKRVDHQSHQSQQQHQQMAGRALHALDTSNEYYANPAPAGSASTPFIYERPYQHGGSQAQMSPDGAEEQFSRESTNGFDSKMEDGPEKRELKQRKRMFANRVKTGCKTCRSRKKKCDEGRPVCKFSYALALPQFRSCCFVLYRVHFCFFGMKNTGPVSFAVNLCLLVQQFIPSLLIHKSCPISLSNQSLFSH